MNRLTVFEGLAWMCAVAACALAGSSSTEPRQAAAVVHASRPRFTPPSLSHDSLRTMMRYVVESNPFAESDDAPLAEERRTQMPNYAPSVGMRAAPGNSGFPRLAAIAGPPWTAVFAFSSNAALTTAEVRDSVAGYRVVAISRDGVVLRGRDTTLRLTLTGGRQ